MAGAVHGEVLADADATKGTGECTVGAGIGRQTERRPHE